MRLLVTIELKGADLAAFEAYEATVLPLLAKYGARLEMRLRALDDSSETHLLSFPNAEAFQGYLADPARAAALPQWVRSGAKSTAVEVRDILA
jgi:hypothetical protein